MAINSFILAFIMVIVFLLAIAIDMLRTIASNTEAIRSWLASISTDINRKKDDD